MSRDLFAFAVQLARDQWPEADPQSEHRRPDPIFYDRCYYCGDPLESQDHAPYCSTDCSIRAGDDSPF